MNCTASLSASLLFALALAAPGTVLAHDHQTEPRTVSVSGEGEVSAAPDRARLTLSVDNLADEPRTAMAAVNKVVRAYLADAKSLGASDAQISTTGTTLAPEYVWDDKARQQKLTGYRARRTVEVTVSDLDKLGDYLQRATADGITQINPPAMESSKATELTRQALAKAAEDARAKAQVLAQTLGARLGAVRSISASDSAPQPPRPVMFKAMAMAAAPAESGNDQMGLTTGEIKVNASVNAVFDLSAP